MINWDRVSSLKADFGEEDFLEITQLFLGEVKTKLDEMANGPDEALGEGFHFLKGGAANLGFAALQEACAEAERYPDRARLGKIIEIYQASKASFLGAVNSNEKVA